MIISKKLKHKYIKGTSILPINPEYIERMYVTGFLGFVKTTYKKEIVSCDRYEENYYCAYCGEDETHPNHNLIVKNNESQFENN